MPLCYPEYNCRNGTCEAEGSADIGIACKRIEQEAESYENSAADNEREHMRNTVHEMLIKFVPAAFLFVVINRLLFTFVGVIYCGFSVNDSFDKLLGLVYSV